MAIIYTIMSIHMYYLLGYYPTIFIVEKATDVSMS